jgi:hypothetical protein
MHTITIYQTMWSVWRANKSCRDALKRDLKDRVLKMLVLNIDDGTMKWMQDQWEVNQRELAKTLIKTLDVSPWVIYMN